MISGYGLHSGAPCRVHLHPSEGAVRFRRGKTEILARLEQVVETKRCTTLGTDSARVSLVEHLLAALYVAGWWKNLVIEVNADELPILDGSAISWFEIINTLGQAPPMPPSWQPAEPFTLIMRESRLSLKPTAAPLSLKVSIDFKHPAIGKQQWSGEPGDFQQLLAARTFGFLGELNTLRAQGLATAASLENAIVFDDEEAVQTLHYPDEPVRHKALDAIGDLFLLGRPLSGELSIERGSHSTHIEFMRELLAQQPSALTTSMTSSAQ